MYPLSLKTKHNALLKRFGEAVVHGIIIKKKSTEVGFERVPRLLEQFGLKSIVEKAK